MFSLSFVDNSVKPEEDTKIDKTIIKDRKLRKLAFECPAWKGGDEKCLLL